MSRSRFTGALVLSLLVGLPSVAMAGGPEDRAFEGPGHRGGPGGPRPELAERFHQLRAKALREDAGLDEQTAQRAEKVLDGFDPRRREARMNMKESARAVRELVRSDSNDQKAYQAALKALRDAQQEMEDLRNDEFEALSKVLTPKEQAKVAVALRELRNRSHRMLQERRGQGRPPHGPPPLEDGDGDEPM